VILMAIGVLFALAASPLARWGEVAGGVLTFDSDVVSDVPVHPDRALLWGLRAMGLVVAAIRLLAWWSVW
jgi:hypothetical protein